MNWRKIEGILYFLKTIHTEKTDECLHNETDECPHKEKLEVEGFETCSKCGIVLIQLFKTIDEETGYTFIEEKKQFKSKYSKIKDIRNKFLDYIINSQKNISKKDYNKFAICWNQNNYTKINKKNVIFCINECNLNLSDLNKYLNIIQNKKNSSNSKLLTNGMISNIFDICQKFIIYYKSKIKNINKKALIYVICKDNNIYLYDYIGFTQQHIILKYEFFYSKYKNKNR